MRPIKFRAWHKSLEQMLTPDMWHNYGPSIVNGVLVSESHVIMQFTGLHDKNGKEIYEGDIVRRWTGYTFSVSAEQHSLGGLGSAKCLGYNWHESDEIIGNIYENPELLKQ